MSIGVADLIAYASDITTGESEVAARAAISHAYYAAFHDCRRFEAELGHEGACPESQKGTHNQLCWRLRQPHMAVPRERKLLSTRRGILLRKLHEDRVRADYELEEQVVAEDARQAIADSQEIIAIN